MLSCYVGEIHTLSAKMVHDSIEINPCSFMLSWTLLCYQNNESLSKSGLKTYLEICTREAFLVRVRVHWKLLKFFSFLLIWDKNLRFHIG